VIADLIECAAMTLTNSWYTAPQKKRGSWLEIILTGRNRGFVNRKSAVGIAPRLRVGRSRLLIPAEARDFSLLQIFQTSCEDHSASCSLRTSVLFRLYSSRGMMWATSLSIADVETSRAVILPLLCLHGVTGKSLHLPPFFFRWRFQCRPKQSYHSTAS